MKTTYHIEQLKDIVDHICEIAKISICVTDTKYNPIYRCEKGNDCYCHEIQKSEIGRAKCHHSDIEMYQQCAEEKRPISRICHAGVLDTVIPILKSDRIVGFIMLGRVRCQENPACIDGLLDWATNAKTIKKHYEKLTYLSDKQLSAVIHLLSYIVFENAIEIDFGEWIYRATDYIETHLSDDLSVATLCAALYVSKNALYKAFHDTYGCTVNQYITTRRIETAKDRLYKTGQSPVLVAQSVGFDNYSYFCKLFKKRTGFSPGCYRKQVAPKP